MPPLPQKLQSWGNCWGNCDFGPTITQTITRARHRTRVWASARIVSGGGQGRGRGGTGRTEAGPGSRRGVQGQSEPSCLLQGAVQLAEGLGVRRAEGAGRPHGALSQDPRLNGANSARRARPLDRKRVGANAFGTRWRSERQREYLSGTCTRYVRSLSLEEGWW